MEKKLWTDHPAHEGLCPPRNGPINRIRLRDTSIERELDQIATCPCCHERTLLPNSVCSNVNAHLPLGLLFVAD